jgi:electron transfer flavoprotein alpha subunit
VSQIFVLAEHRKGSLREITWEMLNKGAELASRSGAELVAVLLGHQPDAFSSELGRAADRVLVVEDAQLENLTAKPIKTYCLACLMSISRYLPLSGTLPLAWI